MRSSNKGHRNASPHPPQSNVLPKLSPIRSQIVNKVLNESIRNDTEGSPGREERLSTRGPTTDRTTKKEAFPALDYVIPGLTEKDVEQLREVFESYDLDKNDLITPMELRNALVTYGYNATKETIYSILAEFDEEERGGLTFTEFLRLMVRGPPGNYESKEDIMKVFKMYDRGRKGYINMTDLKAISKELNEDVDEEALNRMLSKGSNPASKQLTFEDFYEIMIKKIEA